MLTDKPINNVGYCVKNNYNENRLIDTQKENNSEILKNTNIFIDKHRLQLLSHYAERSMEEIVSIYDSWSQLKYHDNPKFDLDFIAQLLGVSKTTISNYINNNLAHISAEKQEKIKQIVHTLGYVPNYTARTIKRSVKKTYGVIANISGTPSREYTGSLLKILHSKCEEVGYSLQLYDVKQNRQKEIFETMPFLGVVDGLFIIGADLAEETYRLLEHYDIPLVLINPWNDIVGKNVLASVCAQLNGLEELLSYAYSNISQEACLITIKPEYYKERQEKINLFARIYHDQQIIYVDDYSTQSAIKVFDKLKDRKEHLFFCLADMTAIIIKEKFSQIGRSVYVTGYDNSDLSSVFNIPTVDHNLKAQAGKAFDAMHEGVVYFQEYAQFPKMKKIMLESIFVEKSAI